MKYYKLMFFLLSTKHFFPMHHIYQDHAKSHARPPGSHVTLYLKHLSDHIMPVLLHCLLFNPTQRERLSLELVGFQDLRRVDLPLASRRPLLRV